MVAWPSGLRRRFKAPVRKGVGSNPTAARRLFFLPVLIYAYMPMCLYAYMLTCLHAHMFKRTVFTPTADAVSVS